MNKTLTPITAIVLVFAAFLARAAEPSPRIPSLKEFAKLPPLSQPSLSPDGKKLATQCLDGDRYGVCVYDLTKKESPISFGISDENKISGITWGSPEHVLVWLKMIKQVEVGGELSHNQEVEYRRIYSFNVKTKKGNVLLNNLGGSISSLNRVAAYNMDSGDLLMQVTLLEGESTETRTYLFKVDLNSGRGKKVLTGERNSISIVVDKEGNAVAQEIMGDRTNLYLVVTGKKSNKIYEERSGVIPGDVIGLLEDGNALAVYLDKGRGLMRLGFDGKLEPLLLDGKPIGETARVEIDPYTNLAAAFIYWDHVLGGKIFMAPKLAKIQAALSKSFPDSRVVIQSWSQDMNTVLFSVQTVGRPIDYYTFAMADGMVSVVGSEGNFGENALLGKKVRFEYQAKDALKISAFVTLPAGKAEKDGPFPVVVMPHGGPHSYVDGGYDYLSQFFASLGYLVFEPNFRGSFGYGDEFFRAGFGEFGGKMVTDVLDGYHALVEQKLAKKDGFASVGASYGGYSALQLATLAPELTKAVVAINAVTDPFLLQRENHVGSSAFEFWGQYLGETSQENIKAFSLLERAELIRTPVMLVAGEQDKTVPFSQSLKLKKDLEKNKKPVVLIELAAEDHYFVNTATREQLLTEAKSWLEKHFPSQ